MKQKNNRKSTDARITSQPWYQDFVRFVELKDLQPRSRKTYLNWLRQLARHCEPAAPEDLRESEVLDFLIALRTERKLKDSTVNQAVCALRTFYRDHLEREWQGWNKIKIRRDQPLPNVMSREEVGKLLGAVRENRFRAIFTVMYHCGLRLSEATHVQPGHIDGKRRVLRVVNGKGGKSREVPVSDELLARLRCFWKAHRNEEWLFPGVGRRWKTSQFTKAQAMGRCKKPMSNASVQNAMKMTVLSLGWKRGGGKRSISCHTLRHCFATHLLDSGVSIRLVSQYLGHASLIPTMVYLHLTEVSESKARDVLAKFPGL
jgi:integrase